jgi:hypothetical protein
MVRGYAILVLVLVVSISGCLGALGTNQTTTPNIEIGKIQVSNADSEPHSLEVMINVGGNSEYNNTFNLNGEDNNSQTGTDEEVVTLNDPPVTNNTTVVVKLDGEETTKAKLRVGSQDCENITILIQVTETGDVDILKSIKCEGQSG